ncbi:MAG TPA: hypothetical protein VJB17_03375 [Patescibacteria group bacterium]|nr:hypothetical protein [Patescibacteria group bacterium]
MIKKESSKIKTTLLLDRTLKKLAQLHALQNDKTLQEVVEEGLRKVLGVGK